MQDNGREQPITYFYKRPDRIQDDDLLLELTLDEYFWSTVNVDNSRLPHHRWYYALALECEKLGITVATPPLAKLYERT